jgi:hypothetical protein
LQLAGFNYSSGTCLWVLLPRSGLLKQTALGNAAQNAADGESAADSLVVSHHQETATPGQTDISLAFSIDANWPNYQVFVDTVKQVAFLDHAGRRQHPATRSGVRRR